MPHSPLKSLLWLVLVFCAFNNVSVSCFCVLPASELPSRNIFTSDRNTPIIGSLRKVERQVSPNKQEIFSSSDELKAKVDRLLSLVGSAKHQVANNATEAEIRDLVVALENEDSPNDDNDNEDNIFTPILGNYDVSHVLPNKPNEKPVGGKWSRGPAQMILQTRKTFQHLLPPRATKSVAQAVNVISLSALFNLFHINVILRGDAYALSTSTRDEIVKDRQTPGGLSARTVRADFDPPRIVLGFRKQPSKKPLLNLCLGPISSVVLDTPYCDNRVRLGKGSKGSRFVFQRCDDAEANDWKLWIDQPPLRKSKALGALAASLGVGLAGCRASGLLRVGGAALSVISVLSGIVVAFSSGGIEDNDEKLIEIGNSNDLQLSQ